MNFKMFPVVNTMTVMFFTYGAYLITVIFWGRAVVGIGGTIRKQIAPFLTLMRVVTIITFCSMFLHLAFVYKNKFADMTLGGG